MKIAIPIAGSVLATHFGHCESFALIEVDEANKKILNQQSLASPPHQPGLLPLWLAQHGANVIIAGGMGQRAQNLFTEQGIRVIIGAPAESSEAIVNQYLAGTLATGDNICDH